MKNILIKNRTLNNAIWIIGCHIIQALFNLVINMLMARYLGPSNYGLLNYAISTVSFVVPLMQLGIPSILVNELVNSPEKEGEILGTSIVLSFISSLACTIGVISFVSVVNKGETVTILVCALYSLTLIFESLICVKYWFQAKLLSKYASLVTLCAYFMVSSYKVFLLVTDKNIYWFAVTQAIDYLLVSAGLLLVYRFKSENKLVFSYKLCKQLLTKSKYYILSSMMVAVFAQTDRIMLKLMINDAETGYYAAAVTCAGITSFVFAAIIDSFRPTILESKSKSKDLFEKKTTLLYSIIIYLSLVQCVFMVAFSDVIVDILYGSDYMKTASILRVLVWYTTFSYVGPVRNIWILAENKYKYLWVINLSGAFVNVALNFILIPFWGAYGAAIASLVAQIFTNFIIGYILKPIKENNKLMIKALSPRFLIQEIKRFTK